MISLDEQTQVPTLKTRGELHRKLITLHGRLIRVRQHQIDYDPYMGGFYENDDDYGSTSWHVNSSDSLGRLQALSLRDSNNFQRGDSIPELTDGDLTVILEGAGSLPVELDRTLVEVFQEDNGRWVTIHRGTGYPQEAAASEEVA